MADKLALKTTLHNELQKTQKEIDEIGESNAIKKECLLQHREFVLKLITICVDRNKF